MKGITLPKILIVVIGVIVAGLVQQFLMPMLFGSKS